MTFKEFYDNLKGKPVSKDEIQQFVNRREDYKHLPADKIQQIAAGSSIARYGVDPDAFSLYTFNAGEIAADLQAHFYIIRFLLDKCPGVKRVVLFDSFYTRGYDLSKSNNKRLCTLQARFLPVPARAVPKSLDWGIKLKCWRYHLTPNRPPHPKGTDFPKQFTPAQNMEELVNKHIKLTTKYGHKPWEWFLRLKDLCTEKQVRLVVCLPPVRSDYYGILKKKRNPQKDKEDFLRLNVPVIDAQEWIEDRFFGDECHLTPEGANFFSRRLDKALNEKEKSMQAEVSTHL